MKIAAIQINSGNNSAKNLSRTREMLYRALELKPDIIVLPEYSNYTGPLKHAYENAETEKSEWFGMLSDFSATKGIHVLAGILERAAAGKSSSTVYSFSPEGEVEKRYTKIHLFDADIGEGRIIRESQYLVPGAAPATSSVGEIMSGFAICYDLRFPELFRYMTLHGAKIIYLPSAFTHATGKSHWETLVRARAIENQVFVVAANQVGESEGSAACFGHSMIVDPWGTILAEAPGIEGHEPECVIASDIDFVEQARVRKTLPCLHHIKLQRMV